MTTNRVSSSYPAPDAQPRGSSAPPEHSNDRYSAVRQYSLAQILGVWQHLGDPDTLVWMIVYRDRAHREQVWDAFNKDPEWDALRRKYFVPLKTNTFFMSAADYSPMK